MNRPQKRHSNCYNALVVCFIFLIIYRTDITAAKLLNIQAMILFYSSKP